MVSVPSYVDHEGRRRVTEALERVQREPELVDVPIAGLYPVSMVTANRCLEAWGHRLGSVNRPFHQEAYGLEVEGGLVAVATSGSTVSRTVAGYQRNEVVELTRLAASSPTLSRVMLRLWRELCAPRWASWPVRAAVSYSHNLMHTGNLYRFDGWERVRVDAGSGGGGTWSKQRGTADAVYGPKSLWVWRFEREGEASG